MPVASPFMRAALHSDRSQCGLPAGVGKPAMAGFLGLEQTNRSSHPLPSITNPLVAAMVWS